MELARNLFKKQDLNEWQKYLKDENKQPLLEEIKNLINEIEDPSEFAVLVRVLMMLNDPHSLSSVLEGLFSSRSNLKENKNLQNLFLLTMIKTQPNRLKDYILVLSNYDGEDVAKIAEKSELYEEAFLIYDKFGKHLQAIEILLTNLNNHQRATEYAKKINSQEVLERLNKN